jgi:outer membrane receptor protein involved in Fe transport
VLANIPNQVIGNFGAPPHKSHLDEYGAFIQDDWRATSRLVFNLGLRYDYYSTIIVEPTTSATVEIVNRHDHREKHPVRPYAAAAPRRCVQRAQSRELE